MMKVGAEVDCGAEGDHPGLHKGLPGYGNKMGPKVHFGPDFVHRAICLLVSDSDVGDDPYVTMRCACGGQWSYVETPPIVEYERVSPEGFGGFLKGEEYGGPPPKIGPSPDFARLLKDLPKKADPPKKGEEP